MTLAGKKLQIIYDSGTESLSNIETDTIAKLTGTANKHAAQQKSNTNTHSNTVETKSQEIESELNTLKDDIVLKLATLKENEAEKCRTHADALKQELQRVGELIKDSVEAVKSGISDRLGDVDRELSSEFDKTYEQNIAALMGSNFEGGKEIRAHANALTNTLQQKLDQSVWESKGSEKQIVAQLYKNYMQKASAIETHFSQIMQKLSGEFQTQYKSVEDSAAKAKASINDDIDDALHSAEQVSGDGERDVNQFFGKIVSEHEGELEAELDKVAKQVSESHSSATTSVKQKTQDYSSSLLTAASSALESLQSTCQDVLRKAELMHSEFLERMDGRVESTKHTREGLEQTKAETIAEICEELATMRIEFEENLTKLTTDAGDSVQSVANEVEKEIQAAHDRCMNKLAEDGQSARNEIEKEKNRVLALIAEHKRTALEDIALAAGVDASKL